MTFEPCLSLLGGPERASSRSLLPFFIGLLLFAPSVGAAQNPQLPSPSEAQQALQQNPQLADVIRQRLQQSGLTADQVRSRLRAAGYPDSLLNAYLGPAQTGQAGPTPGALELTAIQALGLPAGSGSTQVIPVDTGVVAVAVQTLRAESLATGNYVFGVDVFRRSRSQFLPLLAGPVPPDYRLGPGDQLVLIVTGEVEFAYTLPVTREGFVLIPQVGQVYVAHLTLDQLRDVLYARLGRVYSSVNRGPDATTRFDISVANVRANQVYVVGEVVQAGAYQISALGTVLTALYSAGGVTARANMRQIEVRRLSNVIDTLDLYDYLLQGDSRSDIRLEAGDVVFVPVHGVRVRITGAVNRAAIYEVKPAETLADLVRAAGGFRADAALKRISVYRILPASDRSASTPPRAVIDVALAPIPVREQEARSVDPPPNAIGSVVVPVLDLHDGDSVVVDPLPPLMGQYYVAIDGMVQKPGNYPWREGMTLRDLVLLARGPLVGADLRQAEVARMPLDHSQGQLASTVRVPLDSSYLYERDSLGRYVGPPGVPFPGSRAPDVPLTPYDHVLMLRQPDFDFQRTVVLFGEIASPGPYSLRSKSERLATLIQRAGGLTGQAYAEGIRFYRRQSALGRLNIDLTKALADTTSHFNVILQPDDSIYIPEYQPSVKISGAVNAPGSQLWMKGEGPDFYVRAAGGYAARADVGRLSVRYADGEVRTRHRWLFTTSDPTPRPGSEVVIPTKDSTAQTNWITVASAIAGIVTSTIAIVVLTRQL